MIDTPEALAAALAVESDHPVVGAIRKALKTPLSTAQLGTKLQSVDYVPSFRDRAKLEALLVELRSRGVVHCTGGRWHLRSKS